MKLSAEVLQKVRHIEIHTRRLLNGIVTGDYNSSRKGFGLEFDQLRDYQVGDDVRCVDWKSSARADKVLVRQYKEDRNRTIMLVVDGSASMLYGSGQDLKNDLVSQVASVLALTADFSRDTVGMILFSGDKQHIIPPSRGRAHIHFLMETLFEHKSSGATGLNEALQKVIEMKKKDMIVFVLSDFLVSGYEKTLKMLSKRYETFAIACSDPLEEVLPGIGYLTMQDPESNIKICISTKNKNLQILLKEQFFSIRDVCLKARVNVLFLQTNKPFIGDLIRFFKKQIL